MSDNHVKLSQAEEFSVLLKAFHSSFQKIIVLMKALMTYTANNSNNPQEFNRRQIKVSFILVYVIKSLFEVHVQRTSVETHSD